MFMVEIDIQEGRFKSWTADVLTFLGYSGSDIVSMTVFDVVQPEQLQLILEGLQDSPEDAQGRTFDITIKRKNGQWVDILVVPELVFGDDGELKSVKCRFKPR